MFDLIILIILKSHLLFLSFFSCVEVNVFSLLCGRIDYSLIFFNVLTDVICNYVHFFTNTIP